MAHGTLLGPYSIVGQIGAGGMGVVYRAKDTRLGREVAIKVLPRCSRMIRYACGALNRRPAVWAA